MNTNVSVGSVISRAVEIYGKRFGLLIGMAALVYIPAVLIRALLAQAGIFGSLIGTVVSFAAAALFTGSVVRVVQAEDAGTEPGAVGEIFGSVKDRIWPLIWVGIVAGIAIVFGFIFFIIPGLILITIWAVFQPAIVVEGRSFDALSRSRELVKGNGWNVFGVIVCVFAIVFLIGLLATIIGSFGGVVGIVIVEIILSVLLIPVAGLVTAVLYFTLAGGAGQPGDGLTPPPPPPPAPAA